MSTPDKAPITGNHQRIEKQTFGSPYRVYLLEIGYCSNYFIYEANYIKIFILLIRILSHFMIKFHSLIRHRGHHDGCRMRSRNCLLSGAPDFTSGFIEVHVVLSFVSPYFMLYSCFLSFEFRLFLLFDCLVSIYFLLLD